MRNNCILIGKRWDKNEGLDFDLNTYGNFMINFLFNFIYNTNLNDVLCCVKNSQN